MHISEELFYWLEPLTDPETKRIMEKPVLLSCNHSCSYQTAQKLFGAAIGLSIERPGSCPVTSCQKHVTTYMPNLGLQDSEWIVREIETHLGSIFPILIKAIPKDFLPAFTFPGEKARLECQQPWSTKKGSERIYKDLMLKSTTSNSLLSFVRICGYEGGNFIIFLECPRAKQEIFEAYFSALKFTFTPSSSVKAERPHELLLVLRILVEHHALPSEDLTFINNLILLKNWFLAENAMRSPTPARARSLDSPPSQENLSTTLTQKITNWLISLQDPVTLELMNQPVALVPCAHTFNATTVSLFFPKCPTCRTPATSFVPNEALREMAERVYFFILTHLPAQEIPAEVFPPIPFPGKRAEFVCSAPWHVFNPQCITILTRRMVLTSSDPESLLESIELLGYEGDYTHLAIICRHNYREVFLAYLSNLGLTGDHYNTYVATVPTHQELILRVLEANLDLPQEELPFIRRLIQERKWSAVEKEMKPLLKAPEEIPNDPFSPYYKADRLFNEGDRIFT